MNQVKRALFITLIISSISTQTYLPKLPRIKILDKILRSTNIQESIKNDPQYYIILGGYSSLTPLALYFEYKRQLEIQRSCQERNVTYDPSCEHWIFCIER